MLADQESSAGGCLVEHRNIELARAGAQVRPCTISLGLQREKVDPPHMCRGQLRYQIWSDLLECPKRMAASAGRSGDYGVSPTDAARFLVRIPSA
jgi:hypothetical protein